MLLGSPSAQHASTCNTVRRRHLVKLSLLFHPGPLQPPPRRRYPADSECLGCPRPRATVSRLPRTSTTMQFSEPHRVLRHYRHITSNRATVVRIPTIVSQVTAKTRYEPPRYSHIPRRVKRKGP